MFLSALDRVVDACRDLGQLIIRLGVGIIFMMHGWPKISQPNHEQFGWAAIGHAMDNVGIHFGYTFFGFMGAFAEFGGGILMLLGLFFRPTMLMMTFTMLMAVITHLNMAAPMNTFDMYSHALTCGVVFAGMFFIGAGKYSIDAKLNR